MEWSDGLKLPLSDLQVPIQQITKTNHTLIFLHDSPTQYLIMARLMMPVKAVHVNDTHINQGDKQTEPTVLGTPLLFETEHRLTLCVVLVNEWEILIEGVTNLRMRQHFEIHIYEFIFKVDLVHEG
jgi:hypothetical protein